MSISFKQIIRSHIRPYKHYSDDNKLVGTYVMHMPNAFTGLPFANIEFTPVIGTHVETAVGESIKISDKYQTNVWMKFFGIRINVPYKTETDEIKAIVDKYLRTWHQLAAYSHQVAADYSD